MTVATKQVPVFVVSLARATERRERICAHLSDLGITYRLMDAIDGRTLSDDEVARVVKPGLRIHRGAIGCYLSHVEIYRRMIADDLPVALVLEDDARLDPRCIAMLASLQRWDTFDYCFLDSDDHNAQGPIYYDRTDRAELAPGISAYRLSAGPRTTHAYMITRPAAERRLAHAFPITKPIDRYEDLPYEIVFRAVVTPKLAWVNEHSLVSFTSGRSEEAASLSFRALRRYPMFYRVRDLLRLKGLRRSLKVRDLVAQGVLAPGRQWAPLPSGREILR